MPQAATLPVHTPRRARDTREPVRSGHSHNAVGWGSLEARTAALEARWEETVPALATRSDVKAEVRGAENRMTLWILGAGLALAGFCFAILSASEARMDKRIDALDARMDKLDARMDRLDTKLDRLDTKLDAILAELRTQRRSAE